MLKLETRNSKSGQKQETRNSGEIRSISDDGIFEGYLTVWDTVDDYNSTFKRGCFKKTIQERGSKVKIMYNHEELVGSSISLEEDDYGMLGRGRLNLNVEKAREVYELMKDGTLDGLSFGFRTIKEGFESGVRVIKEVALYEYGPVIFPANDNAIITSVRSIDFDESLDEQELYQKTYAIFNALNQTIDDVWWSEETTNENVIGRLDEALSKFHAAYIEFAANWVDKFWKREDGTYYRRSPFANELSNAFFEMRETAEYIAANTSLTLSEANNLRLGRLIENRGKLDELDTAIKEAHQRIRCKKVEELCAELRSNLTETEKRRVAALLGFTESKQINVEADVDEELLENFKSVFEDIRSKFNKTENS